MRTAKNLLLAAFLTVAVSFGAVSDDLIRLIMPDAKVVSGINIATAKNTPFGQLIISQMQKDDKGLKDLYAATGFDPRTDLDQIVLASADPQKKNNGVVLVSGRFDLSRILAALQSKGAGQALGKYKGFDVIQSPNAKDNGMVGFLPGNIGVIGDKASVQATLDRAASSPTVNAQLRNRIQSLSNSYDAWFFSDVPASSITGNLPAPKVNGGDNQMGANALQSIQQTSGGVRFGSNVEVHAEAVTRSDKDATALMNVLQFVAGMIQMNRDKPGADKAASLVDSMVVRTKGPTMTFDLMIPQADIEKMFKENEMQHKGAQRKSART